MNLDLDNAVNNIVDENKIKKLKEFEDVIVFGAGQSGEWVTKLLRNNGIFPACYCDNYELKWGKEKNGLIIYSFETAIARFPDAAICIASMWMAEIMEQIECYDKRLLYRTWDLLSTMAWETSDFLNVSSEKKWILNNIERLDNLYNILDDAYSKKTLEGLLNYRLTRDKNYLGMIRCEESVYLDKQVVPLQYAEKMRSGEVIIDGGAFDGDTAGHFINQLGKNEGVLNFHCYEAGERNCNLLYEKSKGWYSHKVHIHNSALWNKSGLKVFFDESGMSGNISNCGNAVVMTECIDDFEYQNVAFIKLDIEGAERQALLGAVRTIEQKRPVLAICAYHLQDDLLALSDFIFALKCEYKLILRHYMLSSGDTVLYAIPRQEREEIL